MLRINFSGNHQYVTVWKGCVGRIPPCVVHIWQLRPTIRRRAIDKGTGQAVIALDMSSGLEQTAIGQKSMPGTEDVNASLRGGTKRICRRIPKLTWNLRTTFYFRPEQDFAGRKQMSMN